MTETYVHHRIATEPRAWRAVADALAGGGAERVASAGGALYGVWRNQIGRPRDEVTAVTVWPDGEAAARAGGLLLAGVGAVTGAAAERMVPTLRPTSAEPPHRQGNYAFRWFETPARHWQEFLDLCAAGWPGFEAAYDSQVIGLWRLTDGDEPIRSLLLTRRPDLAMWERSKLPEGEAEAAVRAKLSRRYDLCDATLVYTTTLLTAADREDTARWT